MMSPKRKRESSEAQRKAVAKYDREKVDRVLLRLPKGKRAVIQEHIARTSPGTSLNQFINDAIDEKMDDSD